MTVLDGGSRSWPEMYSLAVQQIMAAVGNELEALNKENVKNLYFEAPTTSTSGDFRACYRNIPLYMKFSVATN